MQLQNILIWILPFSGHMPLDEDSRMTQHEVLNIHI